MPQSDLAVPQSDLIEEDTPIWLLENALGIFLGALAQELVQQFPSDDERQKFLEGLNFLIEEQAHSTSSEDNADYDALDFADEIYNRLKEYLSNVSQGGQ